MMSFAIQLLERSAGVSDCFNPIAFSLSAAQLPASTGREAKRDAETAATARLATRTLRSICVPHA
jgi:hypothetical protein